MAAGRKTQKGGRESREVVISAASWCTLVALLGVTAGSAIGVIWSTHKSRHLLNDLQQLEQQRNDLQVQWGQLLLEQSSLVSQGRIENMAIAELGMIIPATENVVVVQGD
jgi:cell division protein FtsL